MNKLITCTLVIALAVTAVSCKKKETTPVTPHYDYTFINATGAPVIHATIYGTLEDYFNQINPVKKMDLALQVRTDGSSGLIEGHEYYVDYYGDDGVSSNWGLMFSQIVLNNRHGYYGNFYYKKGDSTHFGNTGSLANKVILKGNQSTTWHAVDAYHYDSNTKVWGTLSAYEKDVTLKCSYNKLELKYRDTSGNYITTTLPLSEIVNDNSRPGDILTSEGEIFRLSFYEHNRIYLYNVTKPFYGIFSASTIDAPYDVIATKDSILLVPSWADNSYILKRD